MLEAPQGTEVVLIVDDEPSVRAPIARYLKNSGYYVLEAHDGEDALGVMQEYHSPIHLVVTDINMPEMNGKELTELLRGWYPALRVLYISGVSSAGLGSVGIHDDGTGFLPKPFSMHKLSEMVRAMLDYDWEPAEKD